MPTPNSPSRGCPSDNRYSSEYYPVWRPQWYLPANNSVCPKERPDIHQQTILYAPKNALISTSKQFCMPQYPPANNSVCPREGPDIHQQTILYAPVLCAPISTSKQFCMPQRSPDIHQQTILYAPRKAPISTSKQFCMPQGRPQYPPANNSVCPFQGRPQWCPPCGCLPKLFSACVNSLTCFLCPLYAYIPCYTFISLMR